MRDRRDNDKKETLWGSNIGEKLTRLVRFIRDVHAIQSHPDHTSKIRITVDLGKIEALLYLEQEIRCALLSIRIL